MSLFLFLPLFLILIIYKLYIYDITDSTAVQPSIGSVNCEPRIDNFFGLMTDKVLKTFQRLFLLKLIQ